MHKPIGVILAGGRARRMGMDELGGDKGLLLLQGTSLLARVIGRLTPQVDKLVLNANGDLSRFDDFSLPVVADEIGEFAGPLAGILAGMEWAADTGASHIVSAAADSPFFPTDLVLQLQSAIKNQDRPIALAASPDPERGMMRHPTFGLWPVDLRDDLRDALKGGVRKVTLWADRHGVAIAPFEFSKVDPFFNVNRREDLEMARKMFEAKDK